MKNDLEILGEMARQNLDIRMGVTVVEMKLVPQGGVISMGTDSNTAIQLMGMTPEQKDLRTVLLVFDHAQYEQVKAQLNPPAPAPVPDPAMHAEREEGYPGAVIQTVADEPLMFEPGSCTTCGGPVNAEACTVCEKPVNHPRP